LSPSPIGKVLSIFRTRRVRALLMGGQACILYGAAEFSRDVDVAVLANPSNLARLRKALGELRAEAVFVPPEETLRNADRVYWQPLRAELAEWRRARRK
jgi:hypothetical protein